MALEKIKESDLEGKGVIGQPEVPGLPPIEMQRAVEQIVREIAIPKINEVIEYIVGKVATQSDLEKLLIQSGAVVSVFGRAGAIKAESGDYTPEMVGAAKEKHAAQHFSGGSDPIKAEDIGAAEKEHAHGNIGADGRIGTGRGMILVTGANGTVEASAKENAGFEMKPASKAFSGNVTAEDNVVYYGDGISDFVFNCDSAKTAKCRGWVTFGAPGTIKMSGFDFIEDPDKISEAAAGSRWEFDLERGCLIIRKRSA